MDYEDYEGVDNLAAFRGCLVALLIMLVVWAVIGLAILAVVVL